MKRGGTIKLAVSIYVAIAVAMLLPCLSHAGILEPPSGPPVSTMKTLDEIPPTWSQKLPCDSAANCPRFEIVMDGAGVLDKETGLVWQKDLNITTYNWHYAFQACALLSLGGRKGWRLPMVEELQSLVDPPHANPALPVGHPFTNVQYEYYWSATSRSESSAWFVDMGTGYEWGFDKNSGLGNVYVWCVRGGRGG